MSVFGLGGGVVVGSDSWKSCARPCSSSLPLAAICSSLPPPLFLLLLLSPCIKSSVSCCEGDSLLIIQSGIWKYSRSGGNTSRMCECKCASYRFVLWFPITGSLIFYLFIFLMMRLVDFGWRVSSSCVCSFQSNINVLRSPCILNLKNKMLVFVSQGKKTRWAERIDYVSVPCEV